MCWYFAIASNTTFLFFTASVVQQIFRDAMHEIEEKTKVNGKKCIQFRPHHGEAGYVKFSHGSG